MQSKLGVMIIGPGWVAEEHIKAYLNNPHTELKVIAGVLEEDRNRAKEYMEKHSFRCDYTDNYCKALGRDDIDLVSICTINSLHYEQSLACVQAGKHILTEKPLAFSLQEVNKLVEESKQRKVKTHVGHVARFYGAIQSLNDVIRQGAVGEIFYGECDYWHEITGDWKGKIKTGGSSLLMGGVHAVDMLRYLMGEEKEVQQVFAYSKEAVRRKDFEYHPTIVLLVKFKDGSIGKIGSSLECNMPYVFHVQICGTKGTIRNKKIYISEGPKKTDKFSLVKDDYPDDWNVSHHPFPEEIDYFVDCILKDHPSELSFENTYPTYEIIFAAQESTRTGKPVDLPLEL
ncbi:MAG TPA: Gfo/Idh/MocA family oxidoreductase [Candidatus Omnitrophica bacterium]|nr:Gfo/Idh/MocA family oxidoreductase [Candidatus Omnitrophota bacterium]